VPSSPHRYLCGEEAGAPLVAMTLEHYPEWRGRGRAPRGSAEQRWPLLGVTVIHRYGRLEPARRCPGRDRGGASAGCLRRREFLMDYLKTRAPFWKQVEYVGGKIGSMPSSPMMHSRTAGRVRPAAPRRRSEAHRVRFRPRIPVKEDMMVRTLIVLACSPRPQARCKRRR